MKLTTARLRQIIKEELAKINQSDSSLEEAREFTSEKFPKMKKQVEEMPQDEAIGVLTMYMQDEQKGMQHSKQDRLYVILLKQKLGVDLSQEDKTILAQQEDITSKYSDFQNRQIQKAKATNKEPEFQTNPALEESRKRRIKRK